MTKYEGARPFVHLQKDAEEFISKFKDDIEKCKIFFDSKINALICDAELFENSVSLEKNPLVELSRAKNEIFISTHSHMNDMEEEWINCIAEMKKLFLENVEIFLAGTKLEVKLPSSECQSSSVLSSPLKSEEILNPEPQEAKTVMSSPIESKEVLSTKPEETKTVLSSPVESKEVLSTKPEETKTVLFSVLSSLFRSKEVPSSEPENSKIDPEKCTQSEDSFEEVNIETWLSQINVIGKFECEEIKDKQRYPGYLIVTPTHIYILRTNKQKKDYAHIVATHPLSSIFKITSKKSYPEWITFSYGYTEDKKHVITSRDHLLIPKGGHATTLIKYHIFETLEKSINK